MGGNPPPKRKKVEYTPNPRNKRKANSSGEPLDSNSKKAATADGDGNTPTPMPVTQQQSSSNEQTRTAFMQPTTFHQRTKQRFNKRISRSGQHSQSNLKTHHREYNASNRHQLCPTVQCRSERRHTHITES